MPEGPQIRRAADALARAVVGEPLTAVHFAFPKLRHHVRTLLGRRIESITPHGKALLTRFDNVWTLYSHNQLYGVWSVSNSIATLPGIIGVFITGWLVDRTGSFCAPFMLTAGLLLGASVVYQAFASGERLVD